MSVQISDTAGFSVSEKPIRVASDGTVTLGAPIYFSPTTGATSSGVVSVVLVQGGKKSAAASLSIQDLPSLSSYGVSLGQVSHAFVIFEANLAAMRLDELQAAQPVLGSMVDTTAAGATVQSLRNDAIIARNSVDNILLNPAYVEPMGNLPDGSPLQLDQKQLQLMDRLFAAYLTTEFSPNLGAKPSKTWQMKGRLRARHSFSMTTVLAMMTTFNGTLTLSNYALGNNNETDASAAAMDIGAAVGNGATNNMLANSGLGIGLGFAHMGAAISSLFHTASASAGCLGDPSCTPSEFSAINSNLNSNAKDIIDAAFQSVLGTNLFSDLQSAFNALGFVSQSASAYTNIGNLSQSNAVATADQTDNSVDKLSGQWSLGSIEGNVAVNSNKGIATAQPSLAVCCFGVNNSVTTALADTNGNYAVFLPIGASNTNYSSMNVSVVDIGSDTTLASEIVDLSGLNTTSPVQVPPMSVTCNDTDGGSPDGDDPDCD
jgi:hypothetical protein